MRRQKWLSALVVVLGLAVSMSFVLTPSAYSQATVGTGSIQGTILDPDGTSVSSATVEITSKATGQKTAPEVTSAGEYNSGALIPGTYVARVEAVGFKVIEKTIVVQVGVVSSGTVTLEVGSASTVIEVEGSAIQLNTEQATVQGVMTTEQIRRNRRHNNAERSCKCNPGIPGQPVHAGSLNGADLLWHGQCGDHSGNEFVPWPGIFLRSR